MKTFKEILTEAKTTYTISEGEMSPSDYPDEKYEVWKVHIKSKSAIPFIISDIFQSPEKWSSYDKSIQLLMKNNIENTDSKGKRWKLGVKGDYIILNIEKKKPFLNKNKVNSAVKALLKDIEDDD